MTQAEEQAETAHQNSGGEREEAARFVVGTAGRDLLQEIAGFPGDAPAHVLMLRKRGLPALPAALLADVADARKRARFRFGPDIAARLFFTADSLAQATSPGIAAYHAAHLAPLGTVADLGCGAGMDSIALAQAGANVVAIEQDAARLVFARANAQAMGVGDKITFVCGDVQTVGWEADAAYCDPSRREGGQNHSTQTRRVSANADRYTPPLSFVADVMTRRVKRGGCVKLSPALPDSVLDELGGRVEFLSEKRECKEACVWFGDAAQGAGGAFSRAAVLLPSQTVFLPDNRDNDDSFGLLGNCSQTADLRAFVYDPDPALVRVGALEALAAHIGGGAGRASAADSYLVGSAPAPKPLAQTFLVLHETVYNPRLLQPWFLRNGYNRVVVKKRHFPYEPPTILRELGLPLSGGTGKEVVLLLARQSRKEYRAFVCEPFVADE